MTEPAPDAAFGALLEFLRQARGIDFTGYKRASLERRFGRRMAAVGCQSYGDYLDFLEVNPEEYEQLFDALLINVTEFFRDPPAWEHLRADVLPALLAAKPADDLIRVWSAGCASGQEAYTCAMVLAELLGIEAYRERVKIYATDIDENALSQARLAIYDDKEMESVPAEFREKYFERADQRLAFRKDLRRTVIFGRNNIVQDAPISRLDLLVCRNTLIYFNAATQARILRHFHFALLDTGVLMLGKSEMMLSHRDLFVASDLKKRVFVKQHRNSLGSRASAFSAAESMERPAGDDDRASRDAALELGPQALLVVSRTGRLTFANLPARALFQISREHLGRGFGDLGLAHRPVDLLAPIEQALRERRRVPVGETEYAPERGEARRLEVNVTPLLSKDNTAIGASITFEDVTRYAALQSELEGNRRDLELAYEELQSTIDELETTNEELQSANEELQTTNEELQSTNEELESMNEELQSTNEELETMNDELRERTGELNQVNDFLEAILTSLGLGVAVLDAQQRVQVWNRRAEDLWGLRSDEAVDSHFLSLDIGLPSEQLAAALRAVLSGASPRETGELEAVNRRGRPIVCEATILPLVSSTAQDGAPRGAIVMMEDRPRGES
ncbi:PAS domain-containing protein [Solirubrobacter sp. CPCC 204708]|uniref:protein-glutamate O-methyltransferase n=1 Tax=Solirubrobacter deserti TaxID=2282478 RepID=A0ABT4RQY7_9ACTN|nr:CheR family methyltransferase [Solirubrobacter deserti]MBE2320075.1 PAS domain-containing protein [Solirubrobacter deserti]MDA0140985.1 PAS domain-containing protein [Solirubrobacter deserti]